MASQFFNSSAKPWTPAEYQKTAVKFGLEIGGAGFLLDPGLGKTSISLAITKILLKQKIIKGVLVIAPKMVCYNVWRQEAEKWLDFNELSVGLLHGKKKLDILREDHDIYLINPEGLKWLWEDKRASHYLGKMDMLILDESTKFKRTSTDRFMRLRKNIHRFHRRYILTGTPAPNGIQDIFGQIFVLDGGATLGKYITHFRRKYMYQNPYADDFKWLMRPGADKEIYDLISPFCMRLAAEDWLKLPELQVVDTRVDLPPKVFDQYKQLEDEFFTVFGEDGEVLAVNSGALRIKLQQVCNGAVYTQDPETGKREVTKVHKAKVEALEDLVDDLQGSPLLCFYSFRHDVQVIREKLGYEVPFLGNGVSEAQSSALCLSFNAGNIPLLLAHPASVGHGLNLQGASSHVAFYGMTWDLEHYEQGLRRVWRQGNTSTRVIVHRFVAANTVDETISKALSMKGKVQNTLLTALKQKRQELLHLKSK